MVLATNPKDYLARLDSNLEVIDNTTPRTVLAEVSPLPTNSIIPYIDNTQFYVVMLFALVLVLIFLYLMEKDKHYRQHQGG